MASARELFFTKGFTPTTMDEIASKAELSKGWEPKLGAILLIPSIILGLPGAALLLPSLRQFVKRLNPEEVGGAPLLGVRGPVIIGHGRSNAKAIKAAVRQAMQAVQGDIVGAIRAGLGEATPGFVTEAAPVEAAG